MADAQSPLPDEFIPAVDGKVYALAVQPDGKVLVGGSFISLGGQPRTNLARLNADGTLDVRFDPGVGGPVYSLALLGDGKILVGGNYPVIGGRPRDNLCRLNPDGSLDSSFVGRTDGEVRAIALQPDGKLIVAGLFNTLDNEWSYGIGRLNADGTKDFGFGFDSGGGISVLTVSIQADGKILMGGTFARQVGGATRYRIGRWNADGTLDYGFNPGEFSHNSASVNALAVQADGKILAGGTFTNMAGHACYRIARLSSTGAFDSSFGVGADDQVNAFALQADGGFLIAGSFTTMSGQPRSRIARFNPDGLLDTSFNPGANGPLDGVVVQVDGKVLICGSFNDVAGLSRTNLARLNSAASATRTLSSDASSITWLRGGTSPEIWRCAFDYSTNGIAWTRLGDGNRVFGGWEITGLTSPANVTIRARGIVTGGLGNNSNGAVEDYLGAPLVLSQPASQSINAGTIASFDIRAGGSESVSLQWRKNGVPFGDGDKVTGAHASILTIINAQRADEGGYSVVLSNSFGSVTSIVATLTVLDPGIATQPVSQNREIGQTTTLTTTPVGTGPFTFQWWKDGALLSQATNAVLTLTNLAATDAGSYRVVVGNALGFTTSSVAMLTVNAATVDAGFDAGPGDNATYAVLVQPDAKVLVGGSFYNLGGQSRAQIARLNTDGSADPDFNPGANGLVMAMTMQTDQKIVAAGGFWTLSGINQNYLGRLNPDGTPDPGFTNGANGTVFSMTAQPDGAILAGGIFTTFAGEPRTNLARLKPDGTLDSAFNPGADYIVSTFAIQPNGMIIVGGFFTSVGGQPRTNLARLLPDGTLDSAFLADAASTDWASHVSCLALQPDGKILVSGTFDSLGGVPRANLARLNADGTVDPTFNPGVTDENYWRTPSVVSLVIQADGKILLGGTFTTVAGQPRKGIARLNSDGSLDLTFNPGLGGDLPYLNAITLQSDGEILAGGSFTSINNQARTNLARINNTGSAAESLTLQGSTITWLRSGSSPEVSRTTFEHSSNGITWTSLGGGSRISGGWQLNNVTAPAGGTLRARGFLAAGYQSGSSGFAETLIGAPVFTSSQPSNQTVNAGSSVTFKVLATGPAPLSFQWVKNGIPLADGPGVAGAASTTLVLTGVLKSAEGDYRLVVANTNGSITSAVATLTVIDPVIIVSPFNRYAEAGQTVTFTVTAVGTTLSYQWWKDGVALPQGTAAALTLTNVQLNQAGGYRVVVSNPFGTLTSAVATLVVNLATLDPAFSPSANLSVSPLALQADGKILVGGVFTTLGGQTRLRLGRMNSDGSLETGFNPQPNATVYSLALQPDGKILVGGDFTTLAGSSRTAIGRLNTNGTIDTGFSTTLFNPPPGYTLTVRVQAILIQPDGKIIVAGRSSLNGGLAGGFLSRLNSNGTTDSSFIVNGGVNGPVSSLALQPDGKILAGGLFTFVRNLPRNRMARLNSDGSVDATFTTGSDGGVFTLALQADGRILAGGTFNSVAGQQITNLVRLNSDGTLDSNFAAAVTGGSSPVVYSLGVQTDGKILLSGSFNSVAQRPRANLARLNPDGTLDAGFNPGANNLVYGLALQADGRVLVVGDFTQLGGQIRTRIGRLNPTEPMTQHLNYNGASLAWERSGSCPEVWRTTFEFSTNLTSWNTLGTGTRTSGGWKLDGLAPLASGRIRARGYAVSGGFNGSSWFVEQSLTVDPNAPPSIVTTDSVFGFAGQEFGFNLSGLIGQTIVVEGSTNLVDWSPILTNYLSVPSIHFSDPGSANTPARFYRLHLQ